MVLATFVPVTNDDEKVVKVLCIYYSIRFQEKQIKALLNNDNKINAMSLGYTKKLGPKVWQINARAQKIDCFTLEIFEIVIANFQIEDKVSRPKFF